MRYRARFVLPISTPPLRDAWVRIEDGQVRSLGTGIPAGPETDLGSVAILPGLVNAHTHLELSYLHGAVPSAAEFVSWIRGVIGARRQRPDARSPEILDALARGIAASLAAGTAVVGDISNTLVPFRPLAESRLAGVVFHEILRFNAADPEAVVRDALDGIRALPPAADVRASLAAHAPYSVAPAVLRAIRTAMDADAAVAPCSIHVAESAAELEFLATGEGPWRRLLEDVGSWDPAWTVPGVGPVDYLAEHGLLDARMLIVHGVQLSPADLLRVRASGATLVACPRSNAHTGAGVPPIQAFYAAGVRVAVGTDSLASTADLNVFAEIAEMRRLAPDIPARALLDSATRQGAYALGLGDRFGTIAAGQRARLLAVAVPADVDDVEEYLVGGITPDRIAWVG